MIVEPLVLPVPQPDPEHLLAVLDDEGWIEVTEAAHHLGAETGTERRRERISPLRKGRSI